MLVLFQGKIVYMPYMPPFTRQERVEEYVAVCKPVVWRTVEMRSKDGVRVVACVGGIVREGQGKDDVDGVVEEKRRRRRVIVCYFHGNGGSLPPRLPMLSNVLKATHAQTRQHPTSASNVEYTIAALSYRGYWTSSGRPSQAGIELDALALLQWVNETYGRTADDGLEAETQLILWGQSIGAGVATTAAATYSTRSSAEPDLALLPITGLVLETPFTSIKSMLLALYPQKWLPYRYLWPFLRSHWDSEEALRALASNTQAAQGQTPRVLILPAGKDEVVPPGEAEKLEMLCRSVGMDVARREVRGALHNDATVKREGREAVAEFVVKVAGGENG